MSPLRSVHENPTMQRLRYPSTWRLALLLLRPLILLFRLLALIPPMSPLSLDTHIPRCIASAMVTVDERLPSNRHMLRGPAGRLRHVFVRAGKRSTSTAAGRLRHLFARAGKRPTSTTGFGSATWRKGGTNTSGVACKSNATAVSNWCSAWSTV